MLYQLSYFGVTTLAPQLRCGILQNYSRYAHFISWRRLLRAASYKIIVATLLNFVEPKARIELATYSLPWSCSTD